MRKLTKRSVQILKTMDVDQAMKNVAVLGFIPDTREIAIAGMHKTRLIVGGPFTKEEREESRRWLQYNGYQVPGRLR